MANNPYGNIGGMDLGGAVQNVSGIPADFTSAAQALGFMPNMNASPIQQMEDAKRFMALMKNINDASLGSPNASWNRLNPGNPVQAMPMYMRNMYNAYSALANSPAGFNLMPQGSEEMFQNGSWQRGPLPDTMSRMMRAYLGMQNPSPTPTASHIAAAEQGTNTIGNPASAGTGGPSGPPPSPQSAPQSGTPGPDIPVLSGLNNAARNIPIIGAGISGAENAIGDLTGRSDTQGGPPTGGGVPIASGLNDIGRATPGVGGFEDIVGGLLNSAIGRGGQQLPAPNAPPQGLSPMTMNTTGTPAPRSLGLLLQRLGLNAVPQGIDPNAFVDNALFQLLGGR